MLATPGPKPRKQAGFSLCSLSKAPGGRGLQGSHGASGQLNWPQHLVTCVYEKPKCAARLRAPREEPLIREILTGSSMCPLSPTGQVRSVTGAVEPGFSAYSLLEEEVGGGRRGGLRAGA